MNQSILELTLLVSELLKRSEPMPVQSCKILAAEIKRLTLLLEREVK